MNKCVVVFECVSLCLLFNNKVVCVEIKEKEENKRKGKEEKTDMLENGNIEWENY